MGAEKSEKSVMNVRIYNALTDAYMDTESIAKSARAVGISTQMATKYIDEGTENFPSIRERVASIKRRAIKEYDITAARELRLTKAAQENMSAKLMNVLGRIQLVPKGEYALDENGQMLLNERGEPIIQITESSFKSIASTFKMLAALSSSTRSEQESMSGGTVTATVTASSTPSSLKDAALKVAKKGVNLGAIIRAGQESGITAALYDEASLRQRNKDRQSSEVD